ncbi:hypothetical protein BOTBODRAFT_94371, partial [Botryobasidium botryosum FD-172 SS1]
MTPHKIVTGEKPNLSRLPEFGASVWVKIEGRGKLEACADEGHWVGFDGESKGHRVYWPKKHAVSVERNVFFNRTHLVSFTPGDNSSPNDTPVPPATAGAPLEGVPGVVSERTLTATVDPATPSPATPAIPTPAPAIPTPTPAVRESHSLEGGVRKSLCEHQASSYVKRIQDGKGSAQGSTTKGTTRGQALP